VNKKEFSKIRQHLGKSQARLAQMLGVSCKAVQSFEQGWRKIPVHIERHILFLLGLKQNTLKKAKSCWDLKQCPKEVREDCPAWEFNAGYLCWFINGTICEGEVQENWQKKIKICRQCQVFQRTLSV
jgi:transcriptional regulator with XRE-family HTH domain